MDALAPLAARGRRFTGDRKVRLGDVGVDGRLRLDALTRYTQDVSDDDTTDADLPADPGWVVRSTVVDQLVPAVLGEQLHFTTFCSGLGRRWAERRLSIIGGRGARYEVATVWVCIDVQSGQPHPLTERFIELYGDAADGRRASARLRNPKLTDQPPADLCWGHWQLRTADYDVFEHVNNAAYWAVVEQWLEPSMMSRPVRATLEYGAGLTPAASVPVARVSGPDGLRLWWLDPSGTDGVIGTDSVIGTDRHVIGAGTDSVIGTDGVIGTDSVIGTGAGGVVVDSEVVASASVVALDPDLYAGEAPADGAGVAS